MKSIVAILFIFTTSAYAAQDGCAIYAKAVASGSASGKLKKMIAADWKYAMIEYPTFASYVGYPGQNDRWTDDSLEAHARRDKIAVCQLNSLKKIDRKALKGADRLNYDLLLDGAERTIELNKFDNEVLVLSHLDGPQLNIADTLTAQPSRNAKDVQDMLARLEKVPQVLQQNEALLREGLKRKVTPVKMFLEKVPAQFDAVLNENLEENPLYKPFKDLRGDLTAEEKTKAQARAQEILKTSTLPAFKKYRDYVVTEYIPNARTTISWKDMPNGAAWYAAFVSLHTTTKMTPEELHQLGLKEVERITSEMNKVREGVKFKGDLQAFNKYLLTDKKFFYEDKAALLTGFRDIAKRADAEMPKVFKTLPSLPYGVREMPEYKAKNAPAAYYMAGSIEGARPGYFEANTYDLKSRPKWGMEALTLHEAVPGHHMQITIAQEVKGLPDFRKHQHYTAFTEGWGLYAESLGAEMGFYQDPYSKYGQLSYEMWRAVRLVVDTGMHFKGWSRDQSIDYMLKTMPKSRLEAEVEIDRYITWPGQALAYKVGELKIKALREKSRASLGAAFDVREFHDEILRHGALPLDVLEKSIDQWIAKTKTGPKRTKT